MSRPMRVLTVAATLAPGGTAGRILGMVKGLNRQNVSQHIFLLYEPDAQMDRSFGSARPLFAGLGIPIDTLGIRHPAAGTVLPGPQRAMHSLRMLTQATMRLAKVVRTCNIDVIDAHMAPSSLIGGLAGKLTGTPVVMTEYHTGAPAPVMGWPVVGRLALDLSDAVVTDSHARARDLKKWMYRHKTKVTVIPNGIEPPETQLTRAQARALFHIDAEQPVITQISTLRPHKGQDVLLDAARLVLDRRPDARFLIVGFARAQSSDYVEALREKAQRLDIADRVFIGPYEGPIGDVWAATDFHAHATLFDSLPNAIIEGMSLGKPAVVTAVGGLPELVSNGETGIIVPPKDPESFAQALLRVIGDSNLARTLGDAARARYLAAYRSEHTARRLEDLFRQVAGAR